MRTSLDIDPDLLQLAKELDSRERTSAGAFISKLAKAGLHAATAGEAGRSMRNGMEILPSRGEVVTLDHVNRLLDAEGGLMRSLLPSRSPTSICSRLRWRIAPDWQPLTRLSLWKPFPERKRKACS